MPRKIKPGDIYERGKNKYIAGHEVSIPGVRKFWRMQPPGGYVYLKESTLQYTGDTIHHVVEG